MPGLDARMAALEGAVLRLRQDRRALHPHEFVRGEVNYLWTWPRTPVFARGADDAGGRPPDRHRPGGAAALGPVRHGHLGLRRHGLQPGADVLARDGGPRSWCPRGRRWCGAFKAAGARKVILHSDGNIGPLLDRFIDIGFDGINPVEPKAGLNVAALREQYGDRLALLGGIDNARLLPRGDREEIRRHALEVLSAGREGGLVIGTHSIGPDISVETYDYFIELVREQG